jgi:hypothetical protein
MGAYAMRYMAFDNVGTLWFHTNGSSSTNDFTVYVDAIDYSWEYGYYTERSYTAFGESAMDNNTLWESTVLAFAGSTPYYRLNLSCTTNANTTVALSYRTSGDNSTWEAWSTWAAWEGDLVAFYGQRYLQVRLRLSTTNPDQTPTVLSVQLEVYFF